MQEYPLDNTDFFGYVVATFLNGPILFCSMNPARTYVVIAGGVILWCAAIFLAPLFVAGSGPQEYIGRILYEFFHRICHQLDDRSFHIAGEPLAVCMRCTSIYIAFVSGTLAYPLFRTLDSQKLPSRIWLGAAMLPLLIDVCAGLAGFYAGNATGRMITGSLFGLVLPFYIIPAIIEAVHQICVRVLPNPPFTKENQINA